MENVRKTTDYQKGMMLLTTLVVCMATIMIVGLCTH